VRWTPDGASTMRSTDAASQLSIGTKKSNVPVASTAVLALRDGALLARTVTRSAGTLAPPLPSMICPTRCVRGSCGDVESWELEPHALATMMTAAVVNRTRGCDMGIGESRRSL
jgi:hypothetical protein